MKNTLTPIGAILVAAVVAAGCALSYASVPAQETLKELACYHQGDLVSSYWDIENAFFRDGRAWRIEYADHSVQIFIQPEGWACGIEVSRVEG